MKRDTLYRGNTRDIRLKRREKRRKKEKRRLLLVVGFLTILIFLSLKISYKFITNKKVATSPKEINTILSGKNNVDNNNQKVDSDNNEINKDKEQDKSQQNKKEDITNESEEIDKNKLNKEENINEKDGTSQRKNNEISNNKLSNKSYVDDVSIVIPETLYRWNFYRKDNKKIVYLTFDDGPSTESTEKILDILLKNDVKATFFTLGSSIDSNPKSSYILKRMLKEGHSIGNHGYSHNYQILYPNNTVDVQAFMNDIEKEQRKLKEILGDDFNTRLVRMPGGHSSWNGTKELDKVLEEKGLYQMDWNALNGDAEGVEYSKEQLLNNLKETIGDQDVAIVLMHDTNAKKSTVEYLQSAIEYLKESGFEFRTLE